MGIYRKKRTEGGTGDVYTAPPASEPIVANLVASLHDDSLGYGKLEKDSSVMATRDNQVQARKGIQRKRNRGKVGPAVESSVSKAVNAAAEAVEAEARKKYLSLPASKTEFTKQETKFDVYTPVDAETEPEGPLTCVYHIKVQISPTPLAGLNTAPPLLEFLLLRVFNSGETFTLQGGVKGPTAKEMRKLKDGEWVGWDAPPPPTDEDKFGPIVSGNEAAIKRLFDMMDRDQDGFLTQGELERAVISFTGADTFDPDQFRSFFELHGAAGKASDNTKLNLKEFGWYLANTAISQSADPIAHMPAVIAGFSRAAAEPAVEEAPAVEEPTVIIVESFAHPAQIVMESTLIPPPAVVMRYATEGIGTFFLVLVGTHVQPFTTCLILAALTFISAGISQGHLNPAITAAHLVMGNVTPLDACGYLIVQLSGSIAAAFLSTYLLVAPPSVNVVPFDGGALGYLAGLAAPSAAICLVHLAMLSGESRTQYFGLAIGFALFACIVCYGPHSHLFNASITVGNYVAALFKEGSLLMQILVYISQMIAGALAALAFKLCSSKTRTAVFTTEFIGTFGLVFLLTGTNGAPAATLAQTVGLGYVSLVYFGAEISEAQYNPAITLAHLLAGSSGFNKADAIDAVAYAATQLVASTMAAFVGGVMFGAVTPITSLDAQMAIGLIAGAFFLAFVHLNVLGAQQHNGFFGLAVGFTVLGVLIIFNSHVNPAAALGLWMASALLSGPDPGSILPVLASITLPFLGAALAALVFNLRERSGSEFSSKLFTEAVGAGCIIFALFASHQNDHDLNQGGSIGSSFGAASSAERKAIGLDQGLLYAAITYAGGYISGAHYNPAVTMAHMLLQDVTWESAARHGYFVATQTVASVICAVAALWFYGTAPTAAVSVDVPGLLLFSFALVLVHLSVAAAQEGNGFFGIAIGFLVYAGILSFGDVETALFNPATALALFLTSGDFSTASFIHLALLLLVPLAGAFLAKLFFTFTHTGGDQDEVTYPAKLATEAVGTFLIFLTLIKAPGTVGLVYVATTFMGAHISGANYNPAITLAHWLRGDLKKQAAIHYVLVQTTGAFLAACLGFVETGTASTIPIEPSDAYTQNAIFACECIFSFALVLAHCATLNSDMVDDSLSSIVTAGKRGNGYFGLAVGFMYYGGHAAAKSISGGIFNPAAAVGYWCADAIMKFNVPPIDQVLPYVVAPLLGTFIAEYTYDYYLLQMQKTADAYEGKSVDGHSA